MHKAVRNLLILTYILSILWFLGISSSALCMGALIASLLGASHAWKWFMLLLTVDLGFTMLYGRLRAIAVHNTLRLAKSAGIQIVNKG